MAPKRAAKPKSKAPVCGIMMPISEIDGLSALHWADVRAILEEVAKEAGFSPRMVSESDEVNVIHKSIVENLYTDDVAICDVSGLNPNVMFELGMRLAFDKPTVLIKDDETAFSFDTMPIHHIKYRRDLRFQSMRIFMDELKEKLVATYEAYSNDPDHASFLKSFGPLKLPSMQTETVGIDEYLIDQMNSIQSSIANLSRKVSALDEARIQNPLIDSATLNALSGVNIRTSSDFFPSSGGLNALAGYPSTEGNAFAPPKKK
ncbi:hypothetical protein [Hyphomonas sp.]|uniref:hypothetical protein n=1 Tax=Hyphomonas sp. TaxID=87 RepID=UPI0035279793